MLPQTQNVKFSKQNKYMFEYIESVSKTQVSFAKCTYKNKSTQNCERGCNTDIINAF